MKEALRQFLAGAGSIFLAPAGLLPPPTFRITLPPGSSTQAVAHDFSQVSRHLEDAMEKVEHAEQLELGV